MLRRSLASVALVAVMAAFPASATVLVNQPGYINAGGAISSPDPSGGYVRAYDDFRLSANYTITTVSWVGWSVGPATTFQVGFSTTVPPYYPDISFVNETVTPTQAAIPGDPFDTFFSMILPTPVNLTGGTDYFISIYNPNGFWGWGKGDGSTTTGILPHGIEISYRANVTSPHFVLNQIDLAFVLEGVPTVAPPPPPPVPEPATLFLMGAGLGAISLRRRRRI